MTVPNSDRGAITRRDILKLGGVALLEMFLAACGVSPQTITPVPLGTPEATRTSFEPDSTYTPTASSTATDTPAPTSTPSPEPTETPTPEPTETAKPSQATLVELAEKASFTLGSELGVRRLLAPPAKYFKTLRSSFNLGVIDGGIHWRAMEREPGVPDYSLVDEQLSILQGQGLHNLRTLRGHPLYFPSTNPTWLLEGHYRASELIGLLRKRISRLVRRYRGVIKEWVVVNEPFFPGEIGRRESDVLYAKVGEEYIEIAFQAAREADPSAVLIFNDGNNHVPGWPGTRNSLKTVTRLQAQGLVDGVGLHMHLNALQPPTISELMKVMKEYPVPVYITELDVDLSGVSGSQEDRFFAQAKIYSDVLLAALETKACKSLTVWGIGDQYSWLEVFLRRHEADGTLFDDDFNPKPAYFALYELLARRAKGG